LVVGILKFALRISDAQSLKEKRKVVKSLIARIKTNLMFLLQRLAPMKNGK